MRDDLAAFFCVILGFMPRIHLTGWMRWVLNAHRLPVAPWILGTRPRMTVGVRGGAANYD